MMTTNKLDIPLWHWTMPMEEAVRGMTQANRAKLKKLMRGTLRKNFRLPAGFSFCGQIPLLEQGKRKSVRQRKVFQALPSPANEIAMWQQLAQGMGHDRAIRFHGQHNQRSILWVFATQDGHPHTYAKRRFDFQQRTVYHDYFVVNTAERGSGASTNMMANVYVVYSAFGTSRIEMTAGLSDGASVWVRYGFQPASEAAWSAAKATIRTNTDQLDQSIKDAYTKILGHDIDSAVEVVLKDPKPEAIFDLWALDPEDKVRNHCNLRFRLPAVLLKGGRWPAFLDLDGAGGMRLKKTLQTLATRSKLKGI